MEHSNLTRRKFLNKTTCGIAASSLFILPHANTSPLPTSQSINTNVFGGREGYTPHISIMISMMDWMRGVVMNQVDGMSMKDLDYLHDENSNTVGAMLLHLAATEKYYQLNTLDNMEWDSWSDKVKAEWDTPMELGERGRQIIKGHPLSYYQDKLNAVRDRTKEELKKKDDNWIFYTDEDWFWGPTNNYCKWFHVVEHESNHNGQIKYVGSRAT